MIVYAEERLSGVIEEMKPLIELHYDEVHLFKDKVALNPNWERYKELDSVGVIHCATVRDDGALVGYCVSIVSENLHYRDHVYAVNDVLFLHKDYRKAGVAAGLITFAQDRLKESGVSVMTMHMKLHVPFDRLLESLGFNKIELMFAKYIGE